MGRYGSARVSKAALLGAIPRFLLMTGDNPEGVDGEVFEGTKAAVARDRYAYFEDFLNNFSNTDTLAGAVQRPDLGGVVQAGLGVLGGQVVDHQLGQVLLGGKRSHRATWRPCQARRRPCAW
jgi:hypothetical protein